MSLIPNSQLCGDTLIPVTVPVWCTAIVTVTSGNGARGTWCLRAFWCCCKVLKGNTLMKKKKRVFSPGGCREFCSPLLWREQQSSLFPSYISPHWQLAKLCVLHWAAWNGAPQLQGVEGGDTLPFPPPLLWPWLLGPQPKSRISTGAVIAAFLLVQKALGLKASCRGCEQGHAEAIPDKKERFTPATWNVTRSCLPWIKEFSSEFCCGRKHLWKANVNTVLNPV